MKIDRGTAFVAIVCLVIGYWWASSPHPSPAPADRPFLRFVAKVAKTFLWVAVFAEQPPATASSMQSLHDHHVDERGVVMVNHGRGW